MSDSDSNNSFIWLLAALVGGLFVVCGIGIGLAMSKKRHDAHNEAAAVVPDATIDGISLGPIDPHEPAGSGPGGHVVLEGEYIPTEGPSSRDDRYDDHRDDRYDDHGNVREKY